MLDLSLNLNLDGAAKAKPDSPAPARTEPRADTLYDILVLGGGPAGLNAALYASRKGLKVAVFGERIGGLLLDTSSVDNYIGGGDTSGYDLAMNFERDVRALGVPILEGYRIEGWHREGEDLILEATNGEHYHGRTVILATGSMPRHLGVPGEDELSGRGVSYCAICDGPLYRGKRVVISGGGNSAVEAAIDLSRLVSEVTVVQRSVFRADQVLMDEVSKLANVTLFTQTDILRIRGEQKVEGVDVRDKATGEERFISADGVFIEIGHIPQLGPFAGALAVNDINEVVVDAHNHTSEPGVFAAGDVTPTEYKQIVIAAAEGAKAALSVNNYLTTKPAAIPATPVSI